MKVAFSSVLFFTAFVIRHSFVSSIEVIEDFLSKEDVEALSEGLVPGSRWSQTFLPKTVLKQICTKHSCDDAEGEALPITAQVVTKTTDAHFDHFVEQPVNPQTGRHLVVEDDVGLLILNDNDAAEFLHGDKRVPIKSGTFVRFAGNILHQTVVRGGAVHLAGPFHLKSMQKVGGGSICSGTACSFDEECGGATLSCGVCEECTGKCCSTCGNLCDDDSDCCTNRGCPVCDLDTFTCVPGC